MVFPRDYRRRRDAPHSRSVMSTRAVTPGVRHGACRLSDARLPPKNMGMRSWEGNKTAISWFPDRKPRVNEGPISAPNRRDEAPTYLSTSAALGAK